MPISRARRFTAYDITPKTPTAAITMAIPANSTSSSIDARAGATDVRMMSVIACSPVIASAGSASRTICRTAGASDIGSPAVRTVNVKLRHQGISVLRP